MLQPHNAANSIQQGRHVCAWHRVVTGYSEAQICLFLGLTSSYRGNYARFFNYQSKSARKGG